MSEAVYWAVIPAAGIGQRMASDVPKQYLRLGGNTVIEHSLEVLLSHPRVQGAVVAIAEHDERWDELQLNMEKPVISTTGGASRRESVLNALERLRLVADLADLVLVHDAARPCLRPRDIDRLISAVGENPAGGLLGVRVSDTLHRTGEDAGIESSLDRQNVWRAQTPQLFPLGGLIDALDQAREAGLAVTDEASAMVQAGARPVMVEGHPDNIKITRPEDLALAEYFLRRQQRL